MGEIKVDFGSLDAVTGQLRALASSGSSDALGASNFQGDYDFINAFEELYALMEQIQFLWYNAAEYEAAVLENIREGLKTQDRQLADYIGSGLTGGAYGR